MPLCPRTAAWPSGNIAFVLLHNINGGHGSIPAHALPFYYNNNNSWHHSALFSVHSVLFSSVQLSVTQNWSVHSVLSLLISSDQCWAMLSGVIAEFISSQNGWGRRNLNSDQRWSEKSSGHSALISADQNMWGTDKTSLYQTGFSCIGSPCTIP